MSIDLEALREDDKGELLAYRAYRELRGAILDAEVVEADEYAHEGSGIWRIAHEVDGPGRYIVLKVSDGNLEKLDSNFKVKE